MNARETLVARALGEERATLVPLSGGCVSEVCSVRTEGGQDAVAKFGLEAVLEEEAHGLRRLADTETVRVPAVLGVHACGSSSFLLLEKLDVGGNADWSGFGEALARLHAAEVGDRYGFDQDNHLGPTPQSNGWSDEWPAFNRACRHGPLVEILASRGALSGHDLACVRTALEAFDDVLPLHPKPALLHGDLWSGNVLALRDGSVAVIDPAPSIGDALADIAMMQLFGGFPESCFNRYLEASDEELDERRLAVYRLYHMLNHLLIFGGGYLGGVLRESSIVLDGR